LVKARQEAGCSVVQRFVLRSRLTSEASAVLRATAVAAIYVSSVVIALLLNVRHVLSRYSAASLKPLGSAESQEIFDAALRLEQALRKEIGIYDATDFLQGDLNLGPIHSYIYGVHSFFGLLPL
jgi:hypothetical protein